jgi:PKD repeat protein
MNPIAIIGYTKLTDLIIQFNSISIIDNDLETSYLWDFGDDNTSTEQNPTHEYTSQGLYYVTLNISQEGNGSGQTIPLLLIPPQTAPSQMFNLKYLVELYMPTQLIGLLQYDNRIETFVSKWQSYLQPLVINPEVSEQDTYNPISYHPLVNNLISKLVVIDIILAGASAFIIRVNEMGQDDPSGGSGSSTTTTIIPGTIKSIETGPTKVERYENKDINSLSERSNNLSKAFQSLVKDGNLINNLKEACCQEAKRLSIYLPMCGDYPKPKLSFKVSRK